jgi:uncharacterized coiled-coil protein SlyX
MTDRIVALEERLAHFEKGLGELDEVVRDLATQIQKLRDDLVRLQKGLEERNPDEPGDKYEIPPHY